MTDPSRPRTLCLRVGECAPAAAGVVAVGLLAVLVLGTSSRAAPGPFSFPHKPHLSAATIQAGLDDALSASLGRSPGSGGAAGGVVDADCRVCHAFETKAADHHLSQDACNTCHIDVAHLKVTTRPAPATSRPTFPHKEHLADKSITCFTCHRTLVTDDWVEFTMPDPGAGLGARGRDGRPGGAYGDFTCADCHTEHTTGKGATGKGAIGEGAAPLALKQTRVTGDGKKCAQCHGGETSILPYEHRPAGGGGEGGVFLHADHVDHATITSNPDQCLACHQGIRGSTNIWDYDPTKSGDPTRSRDPTRSGDPTKSGDAADKCAECHFENGSQAASLVKPGRERDLPQVDFSDFPHDKHLAAKPGAPGRGKATEDVTPGCATCHYPELDSARPAAVLNEVLGKAGSGPRRPGTREPVGRAALVAYETCTPCHADWEVKNHGVGDWACFKCHEGQVDAATGDLAIRHAVVRREEIVRIDFGDVHHPGITGRGRPLTQDGAKQGDKTCTDCHLGVDVDALRSKFAGRRFDHGPHVNADYTNQDCTVCHTSTVNSRRSADLRRFDPHLTDRSGSAGASCLDCHVGATAAELGISTPTEGRKVPEFDHAGHLVYSEKWGRTLTCSECHTPGGTVGFRTPPEVADCTRCHSHDEKLHPEKFQVTGRKSSEQEQTRCLFCHETTFGTSRDGVVQAPPWTPRKRRDLVLVPDARSRQWHDLSKRGGCADCHDWDLGEGRPAPPYQERVTSAKLTGLSIHDDPRFRNEWFNDPRIEQEGVDPKGRTCRTCHRADPRGYLRTMENR